MQTSLCPILAAALALSATGWAADPAADVTADLSPDGGDGIAFSKIPVAALDDAASKASVSLIDGERDRNGAGLEALVDGRLPSGGDEPAANFFFAPGTDGGRVRIDLGRAVNIGRVATFSWHRSARGPQVYTLYGADGSGEKFAEKPARGTDPESAGWTKIAGVDTRPGDGDGGGRHGVSVAAKSGALGKFRYLLFDIRRTEDSDPFGNTFFSEIDVVDADAAAPKPVQPPKAVNLEFATEDQKYRFVIDGSAAPDLMEWAEKELKPVVIEWYPKIVAMLPSDGFEARREVCLLFRNDMGGVPASAGGGTVNMNAPWFRRERQREARGAVVHELVHVVQSYGRGLRGRRPARVPGWITEGIPDYIRWFLYEPQSRGAEIGRRGLRDARHDASYRVSANFLDWATRTHDKDLVRKLNEAAREGRYSDDLWKTLAGKPVEELATDWKADLAKKLGVDPEAGAE
ncbi:MAG: basic secretory protein-like protein [Verrucomicrobiales bacterium]